MKKNCAVCEEKFTPIDKKLHSEYAHICKKCIKKLVKLTDKEEERLVELHRDSINRYLDKTDWDAYEWLTNKEAKEYAELEYRNGDIDYSVYINILKNLKTRKE